MTIKYYAPSTGEFKNDSDVWFTYRPNTNPWGLENGFAHEIDMCDGSTRSANVKKTRVQVCIDEDAYGRPITETWILKKHIVYGQ